MTSFRYFHFRAAAIFAFLALCAIAAHAQSTVLRTFHVLQTKPNENVGVMWPERSGEFLRSPDGQSYSLGFWFNRKSLNTQQAFTPILFVGRQQMPFVTRGYLFSFNSSTGRLQLQSARNGQVVASTTTTVVDDTWHYFFLTHDQTSGELRAWLDGDSPIVNQTFDAGTNGLQGLPVGAPPFVILGGIEQSNSLAAVTDAQFHTFTLWKGISTTVTDFNNINIRQQGADALLTARDNPTTGGNLALLNALHHYASFDGDLRSDIPEPPNGNYFLWQSRIANFNADRPPVFLLVNQTFQGVPAPLSITVRPLEAKENVEPLLEPNLATTQVVQGARVSFKAPEYIYVDRAGKTLLPPGAEAPLPEDVIQKHAVTRWKTLGYTVVGTSISGTDRAVDLVADQAINFEWQFQKEVALIVDSAVPPELESSAAGNPNPPVNKHWFPVGTGPTTPPRIESYVFDATTANDVRYRIRGYELQNPPATPAVTTTPGTDRYLEMLPGNALNGAGNAISTTNGYSASFWLRAPVLQTLAATVGSFSFNFATDGFVTISLAGTPVLRTVYRSDAWQHWCATYNPISDAAIVYLNGVEVGGETITNSVGNSGQIGFGNLNAKADLDAVRIWTRELAPREVQESMDNATLTGALATGNVIHLAFDSPPGHNIGDASTGFGLSYFIPGGRLYLYGYPGSSDTASATAQATFLGQSNLTADRFFVPVQTASDPQIPAFVMNEHATVRWHWQKEYKVENLTINGTFDTALRTTSGKSGSLNAAGVLWVREGDSVTVTAAKLAGAGNNSAMNGFVGLPTGIFENVTFAGTSLNVASSPVGLTASNAGANYSLTSSILTEPGRIIWNYGQTIHIVQVTLGSAVDPNNTPTLNSGTNLSAFALSRTAQAPFTISTLISDNPADATVANTARWDAVERKLYPVRPGQFLMRWPAENGQSDYLVRVISGFPGDSYKYDDGTTRTLAVVSGGFSGAPRAHYEVLYNDESNAIAEKTNPPIALDADDRDRWFFHHDTGLAYSEKFTRNEATGAAEPGGIASTNVGQGKTLEIAEQSRSVLVFSARPLQEEVATGDLLREQLVVRVVESVPWKDRRISRGLVNEIGGKIARFDGQSALTLNNVPSLVDDNLALDFWAQWTPNSTENDQVLFRAGNSTAAGKLLRVGFRGEAGGKKMFVDFQGFAVELPADLTDGAWHHWSFVYLHDGGPSDRQLIIYRDGLLVSQTLGMAENFTGLSHIVLGNDGIGTGAPFDGLVDNFRIWRGPGVILLPNAAKMLPQNDNITLTYSSSPYRAFADFRFNFMSDATTLPQSGSITSITGTVTGSAAADAANLFLVIGVDSASEVATRITSRLDLAGYGTGFVVPKIANYNTSLYQRAADPGHWGPIYPVNDSVVNVPGTASPDTVWYRNDSRLSSLAQPNVAWPYIALNYPQVLFPQNGPLKNQRIYIASRIGSEGVDAMGAQQFVFDPNRYTGLSIYNQPDKAAAGYNPNEEHALIAPSVRHLIGGSPATNNPPNAVFALRNDLNRFDRTIGFTSDAWVLAQYVDNETGESKMTAWKVEKTRNASFSGGLNIERRPALFPSLGYDKSNFVNFLKPLASQPAIPAYDFHYPIFAGDPLAFPYPLNTVIGASVPPETNVTPLDNRRVFWKDHKGNPWVVSGREPSPDSAPDEEARFDGRFWYPLQPGFWFDLDNNGANDKPVGFTIPWLPTNGVFYVGYNNLPPPNPQPVRYEAFWKRDYPVIKTGETLTYAGGEYKKDHPEANGLPAVVGWAAGQVIFDTANPTMAAINRQSGASEDIAKDAYSARIIRPLDERTVSIAPSDLPPGLIPTNNNVLVRGTQWFFTGLSASLQKRVIYDTVQRTLTVRGLLNDRGIGDPSLTSTPISLYVLEPNILSAADRDALQKLDDDALTPHSPWDAKIDQLYNLSRNPTSLDLIGGVDEDLSTQTPGLYYPGLMPVINRDGNGNFIFDVNSQTGLRSLSIDAQRAEPLMSLGAGSALVVAPKMLDFTAADFDKPIYVTLAENNHPDLGAAPVALHVIRISPERFRGGLKEILPPNAFDEKITLRHTADFGGAIEDIEFEWYATEVDGEIPSTTPSDNPVLWNAPIAIGGNPVTTPNLDLIGLPERLLSDQWVFARYRKVGESAFRPEPVPLQGVDESEWLKLAANSTVPFQWAGASNSPQVQANGDLRYIPALATGWVKRVLDRINPYEARINDFYNNNSPATYTSMIQQAGARPLGPVALNSDKNVVENVGLIALYQTVLDRAFNLANATLSDTNGVQQALLLAATRIRDFYMLLGNEAYSDALDPTIGLGTGSIEYGKFAPTVWSFQNQESSLLSEELALLRGSDFAKAWPVDNRLFWNFVKGDGEAAYANNYQISDVNHDGFINEFDAAALFPQGHGDAWGSYTTALRVHYRLFQSNFFRWLTRAEFYNLADNVLEVDYLDEQKFAETAAARARAGTAIVRNTYRAAYTAHPDGQWQGYTDVDPARAWGVKEWGKRAGQGAYFDWVTANSLLPAETPDRNSGQPAENLENLDRSSITAVGEIATSLAEIQAVLDDATLGVTPVGVGEDAVPFDIDPTFLAVGSTAQIGRRAVQGLTQFDQIFERAISATKNAIAAFDYANQADQRLRQVITNTEELTQQALDQDIAFNNRLKTLLGTPYAGTIGSGKLYPAGYKGPDLFLWQYVDRTSAQQYLPPESGEYKNLLTTRHEPLDRDGDDEIDVTVTEVPDGFETLYSIPEASTVLAEFFRSYLSLTFWDYYPERGELGKTFALGTDLEALFEGYPLPIYAEASYGFQAPPAWGQRAVTGQLQSQVNSLVGAQINVMKAVDDYQAYLRELRTDLDVMFAKQEIMLEQTDAGNALMAAKETVNGILLASDIARRAIDIHSSTTTDFRDAINEAFPKVVGTATDATSAARAAIRTAVIAQRVAFDSFEAGLELTKQITEFGFQLVEGNFEIYDDVLGRREDLIASARDLQMKINAESTLRFAIASSLNELVQQEQDFSRLVDETSALLEERQTANQRLAANVQRERYNDMTLRVTRNAALQKYQDSFELAARYTYLATKAYAYDTNLADSHPANATPLLTEIVSARLPGHMDDNEPGINGGGLCSVLAKLWANYSNLRGQLGINNPQFETGKFSLRHELFRVKKPEVGDVSLEAVESHRRWRQVLNARVVPNLWNVPEFRTFCVAPWAQTEGAQPGLVIAFDTAIFEGKNFFGWPLGGRDQSYDASQYSTKIMGAGIWLEGYDGQNLAVAPRVWLVPAGEDIMRIPGSPDRDFRHWNIVDQTIPMPYITNQSNLINNNYLPWTSSITEPLGQIRKFSRMRAYHDDGGESFSEDEVVNDTRLMSRSVWNTKWMLIIPGSTLSADAATGMAKLIGNDAAPGIRDIRLIFNTYSASGN